MLHEKLEPGLTSDKLIKRLRKKYDLLKIARMLRDRRHYMRPGEVRRQEKNKSVYRQLRLREKQQ